METSRFGFMPPKKVHPFLKELNDLAYAARISMSSACAEALGEPEFPAKLRKNQVLGTDEKIELVKQYFAGLQAEKLNKKLGLQAPNDADNEKQHAISAEQGSKALLRALLTYGLNHNGLPGMSAVSLVDACHKNNIKTTSHHGRLLLIAGKAQ